MSNLQLVREETFSPCTWLGAKGSTTRDFRRLFLWWRSEQQEAFINVNKQQPSPRLDQYFSAINTLLICCPAAEIKLKPSIPVWILFQWMDFIHALIWLLTVLSIWCCPSLLQNAAQVYVAWTLIFLQTSVTVGNALLERARNGCWTEPFSLCYKWGHSEVHSDTLGI